MKRMVQCSIELTLKSVTCPGVWLPINCGDVYLSVRAFGQRALSRHILPIFPLNIYEKYHFTKDFVFCSNLQNVLDALTDETVFIELLQINYQGYSTLLATYRANLRDFLFPMPTHVPTYSGEEREILLNPTIHFRGIIGPRLEFATNTSVDETMRCVDELHSKDSHQSHSVVRGRQPISPSKLALSPRRKSTSASRLRRQSTEDVDKPPFVVRKINESLLSRTPSLFQISNETSAYCCASPHRQSYCAACRKKHRSPSPKLSRRWSSQPSLSQCRSTQPPNNSYARGNSQYDLKEAGSRSRPAKESSEDQSALPSVENDEPKSISSPTFHLSPRLKRWNVSQRSSLVDGLAPSNPTSRSPIFTRPTFHDRFAEVPVDVIMDRCDKGEEIIFDHCRRSNENCCDTHNRVNCHTKLNSGVPCSYCQNCRCSCNQITALSCRCPYCPSYWKFQLGPSQSRWQLFNHGLASLYGDMYRYPGYF